MSTSRKLYLTGAALLMAVAVHAKPEPNVIVYFANDISARDFPAYGSSVWNDLKGQATRDPSLRARTPVMDRLAEEGVAVKNAGAATICNPSRVIIASPRSPRSVKYGA